MSRSYECADCTKDVYKTDGVYMLKDSVWFSIYPSKKGFLCLKCTEKRLGRKLVKNDFNDTYVNKRNFGSKSIDLCNRLGF